MKPKHIISILVFIFCLNFKIYANSVLLESVSFLPKSEPQPFTIVFDEYYQPLTLPHWDFKSEKKEPAFFIAGQEFYIKAVFKCLNEQLKNKEFKIDIRSDKFKSAGTSIKFNNDNIAEALIYVDFISPDCVKKVNLEIDWEYHELEKRNIVELTKTSHLILFSLKKPIRNPGYRKVIEWAVGFADGLSDDKKICDALIENLYKTGLRYGINGGGINQMIQAKGGMCGDFATLFCELASSLGVKVYNYGFSIQDSIDAGSEERWTGIDILSGGLNNKEPTYVNEAYFVHAKYPFPYFESADSPVDDVVVKKLPMYRFAAMTDGHAFNYLKYKEKLYLYDPSFGAGPFEDTFESFPKGIKTGSELNNFRKNYFDKCVNFIQGKVKCNSSNEDELITQLDIKTSLIQGKNNVKIKFQLFEPEFGETIARFRKLNKLDYYNNRETDEKVNWKEICDSVNPKDGKNKLPIEKCIEYLKRKKPLGLKAGIQPPGLLSPLNIVKAEIIRTYRNSGNIDLKNEIERLLNDKSEDGLLRSFFSK